MRSAIRVLLFLNALALAAGAAVTLLVLGLPMAAHQSLRPGALGSIAVWVGAVVLVLGTFLLWRAVGRPVDRLLIAARGLSARGAAQADGAAHAELPLIAEASGLGLTSAAVAFERLAHAFAQERSRLAEKVVELTRANTALAEAREIALRTEKLATVGRLAAGLAHEVGNPLGAIEGYVALARMRLPPDPNPELLDALGRISEAARRIDRTVRDLLDFARPSSAMLAPIDLAAVVDASVRLARVQGRFRDVQVELDLPTDLPRIQADEHHLSQALLNLLLNAGDATGGRGHVRLVARQEPAGRVALMVEDDGPGIPPADLPRIFDPFFTTKQPGEGTGLGLAICHRIMESFQGEISARNREGGGAVFSLRFRAAPPAGGAVP